MGGQEKVPVPYDVLVIGSGSAGISAAEAALDAGAKKVAVVERSKKLGGECPNRGCIPTKALLRSVEILSLAKRAKTFGLRIPKVRFSLKEVMARKDVVVDRSTGNRRIDRILEGLGVDLIKGSAKFVGPHEVKVGKNVFSARKIVIATGSETFVPPVEGLKESGYLTSDDAVELKKLPKSLLVIGGGPIGVEWAQIFHGLGCRVTVVEFMPHLLPREDEEIAAVVEKAFASRGIAVMTSAKVVKVAKSGARVRATIEPAKGLPAGRQGGKQRTITAEKVMVAAGKRVALGHLDIGKAGVALDGKGRPVLASTLQTTNKDIYIAGDAAGQMMFTHVAHHQGAVVGANAVKGNRLHADLRVVPRGTFCTPEVGSVGMTEAEARKEGHDVGVGRAPYGQLGKSSVMEEPDGLIKIVVDRKTKKVLGGHVAGHAAAEIVHEIALAMQGGLPYTALSDMIHAFPTFSEGVGAAAYNIE